MKYKPIQTSLMSLNDKFKNYLWKFINKTFFRFSPSHFAIFRKYRVLWLKIFGAKISWSASIDPTANIDFPWNLTIGDYSSIGEHAWVYALCSIKINNYSCIGKNVYLLTGSHDIDSESFVLITKPITIGHGCWVSTSSIILPGITLEDFSVVGAGSVVVKNVEECMVVGGNPAKTLRKRFIKG